MPLADVAAAAPARHGLDDPEAFDDEPLELESEDRVSSCMPCPFEEPPDLLVQMDEELAGPLLVLRRGLDFCRGDVHLSRLRGCRTGRSERVGGSWRVVCLR